MSILETLSLQGISLKRVTSKEYAGACPKCGGNDRFKVFTSENRYYCRGCKESGDEIDFLRNYQNKSFDEACKILGKTEKLSPCREKTFKPIEPRKWQAVKKDEPGELYQRKAAEFIEHSHKDLLNNSDMLNWLKVERGINLETVIKNKLGYNRIVYYPARESWGLETELNDSGKPKKLYLPAGLTIPVFRNNKLYRIKIRRHEIKDGEARYIFVSGGSQIPLIIDGGSIALIVESELDAILLSQEAKEITCIAFGSCVNRPDDETFELLKRSSSILIALDSDEAGAKAAFGWWKETFPESNRWLIPKKYGKDPSEAWKNGFPLSRWVELGIKSINENQIDAIGRPITVQKSENVLEDVQTILTLTTGTELDSLQKDKTLSLQGEYLKELYNERAAILEFDAGMSRADAERMARKQIYGDNMYEKIC